MTDLVTLGFRADTRDLTKAQKELDKTAKAGGKVDGTISKLSKTVGVLGTAFAALGLTRLTQDLLKHADSWKSLSSQIRLVTDSETELNSVRGKAIQIARETRSNLDATVKLYAALDRSTTRLGVSTEKQLEITKTINNMFLAGGKSAAEASGAIRQLIQGLEAGALRGDEFNSVAEGAPRIMDALANSLKMTRSELREFAATGGITAEIVVKALDRERVAAQRAAEAVELTYGQSLEVAGANITEFVGKSESLLKLSTAIGGAVLAVSSNLDPMISALGAAAAVVSVAMLPAAKSLLATWYGQAAAALTATPAITGMSAALGVQAARATTATIATNALNIATKALLGPVGLVISAVGAAAIAFGASASASEADIMAKDRHAAVMAKLAEEYSKYSSGRLSAAYIDAQKQAMEIDRERIAIQERLEKIQALQNSHTSGDRGAALGAQEVLALKERLEELAAQGQNASNVMATINKIFEEGLPPLSEWKEAVDTSAASTSALSDGVRDLTLSLAMQHAKLTLTTDEYEILEARQRAIAAGAGPAMVAYIEAQVRALQKLRAEQKKVKDAKKKAQEDERALKSLTDQVEGFGGAWKATGSAMVDAFGDAAAAMDDFGRRMANIHDLQAKLTAQRGEYAEGSDKALKIDKALADLQSESSKAQLGAISDVMGASSRMFKEGSRERKALHMLEMGFAAAEMAIAVEKMILDATGAVAKEGSRTGIPGAIAMTAIMAGALGAVGVAFGGGGGATYTPPRPGGTGTVLGDPEAQSQSIAAATDLLNEIQIDQLGELRGIRASINQLNAGISQLASGFVTGLDFSERGFSGQLGTISRSALGFGSTKKELVDSGISFVGQTMADVFASGELSAQMFQVVETTKKKWFGLSKSNSFDTTTTEIAGNLQAQMGAIFQHLGTSVIGAAQSLGITSVDVTRQAFADIGFEFDERMGKFGRTIGATFETVTMPIEEAIDEFRISIGRVSFKDMTGEEIEKELQAIFSQQGDALAEFLVPSIKEYQKVGEGAFETLQRVAVEQAVFNDAVAAMGFNLGELSALMKIDVAQGILSMMGGLEAFQDSYGAFMKGFFSDSERTAILAGSLSDVFGQLGMTVPMTRDGFRDIVQGLDLTTEHGQMVFATLMQVVPAMDSYLSALEKEAAAREDAARNALGALNAAIEAQKGLAAAQLDAAREQHKAEADRISGLRDALEAENALRTDALDSASSAVQASASAEISAIQSALSGRLAAISEQEQAEIAAIKATAKERESALKGERQQAAANARTLRQLADRLQREATGGFSVQEALTAARGGDFSKATNVQRGGDFGDAVSKRIAEAVEANQLAAIAGLAGAQATIEERTLASLDAQIEATTNGAASQVAAIRDAAEAQRAAASAEAKEQIDGINAQVSALLGLNGAVLPLGEAIEQYQAAQLALDELGFETELAKLDLLIASNDETLALHEQAYADEIERLDSIWEQGEAQLNALLGIDNSVMSVEAALSGLHSAIGAVEAGLAALQQEVTAPPVAPPTGGFLGDLGQQVGPMEEVASTMRELKEDNRLAQMAIAKHTASTAKALQRIELDGLTTRTES